MKILLISTWFVLSAVFFASGQNLVGCHISEIKRIMKIARPKYTLDDSSINTKNSSIKYVDKDGDNTLVFFLDEKGNCKYSKFMLEVGLVKNTVDTLTRKYRYLDNLTWLEEVRDNKYIIKMQNSEWFFTILITEKND